MEHLSDEELLELTPRRPAAFEQIYIRHERLILAYFRRRTRSADLAVDLTAETFVAALAAAKRFKPGDTPAVGWLLGIARHKLLRSIERGRVEDRARRQLGTQRLEFDDEELERVDRLATMAGRGAAEGAPARAGRGDPRARSWKSSPTT